MDLFEFYKESYYKELDKKDEINNGLAVPMSIASGMFAGLFFMGTTFCYDQCWAFAFVVLIGLSGLLLLISVWYLFLAYNDSHLIGAYTYKTLSNVQKLDDYYRSLKDYHSGSAHAIEDAKKDFEKDIMQQMITATASNQENNVEKLEYFRLCRKYLLFCLISGIVTLLPFGVNYAAADHTPVVKVKMADTLGRN